MENARQNSQQSWYIIPSLINCDLLNFFCLFGVLFPLRLELKSIVGRRMDISPLSIYSVWTIVLANGRTLKALLVLCQLLWDWEATHKTMSDHSPPGFVLSLILVALFIPPTATNFTLPWFINVLFPPVGPEDVNAVQYDVPPLIIGKHSFGGIVRLICYLPSCLFCSKCIDVACMWWAEHITPIHWKLGYMMLQVRTPFHTDQFPFCSRLFCINILF